MYRIFISYSSKSKSVVAKLASDLSITGHEIWFDHQLTGGQAWWDQILTQIRECDIFIFALTTDALESYACKLEYTYAHKLGKPVLPVKMNDDVPIHQLPSELQLIQFVDYTSLDTQAAYRLINALNSAPPAAPLPDPLPEPPPVPLSYVGKLREQIDSSAPLSFDAQASLVFKLRERLQEGDSPEDAVELLNRLRKRDDLYAKIDREIEELLPASRPSVSRLFSVGERSRKPNAPEPAAPPPRGEPLPASRSSQAAIEADAITIHKRTSFLIGSTALFGITYLFADSPLAFNTYSIGSWVVCLVVHGVFTQFVLGGSLSARGRQNQWIHLLLTLVSGGPLNGLALRRLKATVSWPEVLGNLMGWGVAFLLANFAVFRSPLGEFLFSNWDYGGALIVEGGLVGLLGALITWFVYRRHR